MASIVYSIVYGPMGTGFTAAVQICNPVSNMFIVVSIFVSII